MWSLPVVMPDGSGKHELRFNEAHRLLYEDIVVLEMTVQRLDHAVVLGPSLPDGLKALTPVFREYLRLNLFESSLYQLCIRIESRWSITCNGTYSPKTGVKGRQSFHL